LFYVDALYDKGLGFKPCIATVFLLPKKATGDKVFMYRGCDDDAAKAFLRSKNPGATCRSGDDGGVGRLLAAHTGATDPEHCGVMVDKTKDILFLYCPLNVEGRGRRLTGVTCIRSVWMGSPRTPKVRPLN